MATPTLIKTLYTPEQTHDLRLEGDLTGFNKATKNLVDTLSDEQVYQSDDKALIKWANQWTKQNYGDRDVSDQRTIGQMELDKLRKKRDKGGPAVREALQQAVNKGASFEPGKGLATFGQVQAMLDQQDWQETRQQAVDTLVKAGKVSLKDSPRFAQGEAPPEIEAAINAETALHHMGAPEKFRTGWLGQGVDAIQRPARAVSGAVAGLVHEMAARKAGEAPNPLLEQAVGYGVNAATGPGNSEYQLDYQLQKIQNQVALDAAKGAVETAKEPNRRDPFNQHSQDTLGGRTVEQVKDQATKAYEDIAPWAVQHPNLARLGTEVVLDPLTFAPVDAVLGAAKGVGKAAMLPWAEDLTKVTDRAAAVGEGFKFAPQYGRGAAAGSDLEALGQLSAEQAQIETHTGLAELDQHLAVLQSVPKGEQRQLLMQAIEGKVSPDTLAPKLQKAYQSATELANKSAAFEAKTGLGNKWSSTGELQTFEPIDKYVPHYDLANPAEEELKDIPAQFKNPSGQLRNVQSRSAFNRTSKNLDWTQDPVKQWELKLSKLRRDSQLSLELKKSRAAFEEQKLWVTLDTAGLSPKLANEAMAKFAAQKTAETGMPWVALAPNLEERLQRTTGVPGLLKGSTNTIVPAAARDRFLELMALTQKANVPDAAFTQTIKDINRAVFQPAMQVWKATNTLSPTFLLNNVVGNFGMGYLAQGLQYFNPAVHVASAGTVLLDALKQAEKIAVPFPLRTGKMSDLGQLYRMAKEDGILGQIDFRLAYEVHKDNSTLFSKVTTGTADMLAHGKFSPAATTRKISSLGDDYHKFVTWLNVLEDVTPVARARAAQRTAELAGNFRRLGSSEKYLREFIPYYSWLRFVSPFVVRQGLENPQRLADFAKFRGYLERKNGVYMPSGPEGVPDYLADNAVTAPASRQSEKLRALIQSGQVPPIGSHEAAMMIMQDPITMGLWWIPMLEGQSGLSAKEHPEAIAQLMGPMYQAMFEMIYNEDFHTGRSLPEGIPGRLLALPKAFVGRPMREWGELRENYKNSAGGLVPDQLELSHRYASGRYFLGMDNWIMETMGKQGFSIPSYPGGALYVADPITTAIERNNKAVKSIPSIERNLEQ